jgi:hypothetical protein
MLCNFRIGWIPFRVITAGFGHPDFGIIRDRDFRQAAEEMEPRTWALIQQGRSSDGTGFGTNIITGLPDGDEQGMVGHLSGFRMGDGDLLTGVVVKDLFSDSLFLPKSIVQFLDPMALEVTELTELIAIGRLVFVLKPKQLEKDPGPAQFQMDSIHIRGGALALAFGEPTALGKGETSIRILRQGSG